MKKRPNHILRFACPALAAGLFLGIAIASAEESTTYAPEPVDRTGNNSKVTAPDPQRLTSMAAIGTKPSKAELAKMEAEKAAKAGTAKPANAQAAATKAALAQLDAQDNAFMMEAAAGCMGQVDMGTMAAKKGTSADLKKIGKMMASEHARANKELMALAKKKGVKLAASHKAPKMEGADFDAACLAEMAKSHKEAIAACEKEAKKGKDADVKGWASKMLPNLKSHLKMVQDAQKSMKKSG